MTTSEMKKVNVVVIGETGSGKSTVINYITNYFRQGTFDHMKIAIPTEFYDSTEKDCHSNEHNVSDQTQSKTTSCNEYNFEYPQNNSHFCFIDTPGVGDTRGIQFDKLNIKDIFDLVQKMETLTAILLIINGTQPRLTFNTEYVLQQFRHWLPNVMLENVVIILTNCTQYTVNFEPTTIGLPSMVKTFHMQNSAFSNNPKKMNSEFKHRLEDDWAQSMNTLEKIVGFLDGLLPLSTQVFIDMDSDKNELRSLLHESRLIIKEFQSLEDALETKSAQNQTQKGYMWTSVSYHNTLCSNCHCVCHEQCTLNEVKNQGDTILAACTAFNIDGKSCTKCPGKCNVRHHYHARKSVKPVDLTPREILLVLEKEHALKSRAAIEKKLGNQLTEIESYAEHLVKACAEFNIADEIDLFIKYLQNDIKMLKSQSAERHADDFLNKVINLCKKLSNQSYRSSVGEKQKDSNLSSANRQKSSSQKKSQQKKASSPREDVQKQENQTFTKDERENEDETAISTTDMEIDEHYQDPEGGPDQYKQKSSKIKEFEEHIDRHIQGTEERARMVQDEEEYHLLKLYRLLKSQDRNALLRGAEKLAKIPD